MNESIGRFQNMDTFEGDNGDPLTLHKYLFVYSNPLNEIDPTGNAGIDTEPIVYWPASDKNNRSYFHTYSQLGIDFTESWEGYSEFPYDHDGGSNATIGFGHLIHRGPLTPDEIANNKKGIGGWSVPRAEKQLQDDTSSSADDVNSEVTVPLAQYEFDAFVDFRFSIGPTFFNESEALADVNLGKYSYIPGDFAHFLKSNGNYAPGLFNRRCAEGDIFCEGKYQLKH